MGTPLGNEAGYVTDRMKSYYEERAKGGVALVIVQLCCVDAPVGQSSAWQIRIDNDRFIPDLKQLAQSIKKHGAKAGIQLHHAGHSTRPTFTGQQPVGPSPVARPGYEVPRELTVVEIQKLASRFAEAAARARQAGFDCVEIHAAHLYLFAQFLSSAWNKRQDAYGGDLKGRARFLVETLGAIKGAAGADYPVWCRINGVEYGPGGSGFSPDEAQEVARMLQEAGSDAIHVSAFSGFQGAHACMHIAPMSAPRGLLLPLAEGIKRVVNIPVIAVGRIDLELGEKALREKRADFIAMGRALIADPELPNKAASGRIADIRPCLACNVCADGIRQRKYSELRCSVNAVVGEERKYAIKPAKKKMTVLIVGGGPAGMEAARVAAIKGHFVTLYEQNSQLGGQMLLATIPPHKEKIRDFTSYLAAQLEKLPIQIKLGEKATPAHVERARPDVVILATGVFPLIPDIPGASRENVVTAEDVLSGKAMVGQRVVVIGGELVGCETAEFLAIRGKHVTIVRRGATLATKVGGSVRERLLSRLAAHGVTILTGVKYQEINNSGLRLTTTEGVAKTIEADTIVLAAGSQPNTQLSLALKNLVPEVYLAGDCVEPRNIMEAITDGYRIAHKL